MRGSLRAPTFACDVQGPHTLGAARDGNTGPCLRQPQSHPADPQPAPHLTSAMHMPFQSQARTACADPAANHIPQTPCTPQPSPSMLTLRAAGADAAGHAHHEAAVDAHLGGHRGLCGLQGPGRDALGEGSPGGPAGLSCIWCRTSMHNALASTLGGYCAPRVVLHPARRYRCRTVSVESMASKRFQSSCASVSVTGTHR